MRVFKEMIEYIGKKESGLFIPVSNVLDMLLEERNRKRKLQNIFHFVKKIILEFNSLKTRIKYRFLKKIDDYHFKKSDQYNEINL